MYRKAETGFGYIFAGININSVSINNTRWQVRAPLLMAAGLAAGILIGISLFKFRPGNSVVQGNVSKFGEVMSLINQSYVDSVNTGRLVDGAIENMLERLDPHSIYIPRRDVDLTNSDLKGEFEGIGIEFNLFRDTIVVVTALPGGPSANDGIESGDKIIKVNGENVAGIGITIRGVIDRLRGEKGSKVLVSIQRRNKPRLIDFSIVRDKIPQFSVDAGYMIDDKIGYIKISRFSSTTYDEFHQKMKDLLDKGMTELILDLQDNPGGYMDRAVDVADELIGDNEMIVSQRGKQDKFDAEYRASRKGLFETEPVIVLIDENSASGSEIVAGALQDDDRALLVGRRSFGKGLVQVPMSLSDGSELRLTIARYFTPSGRSIQKPYNGNINDYIHEYNRRYTHGELFHADSIHFNDSLKYHTMKGRLVYGGGGIMPDVFVPLDTSYNTPYFAQLVYQNVLREFALDYYDAHKDSLSRWTLDEFIQRFTVSDRMLRNLISMGQKEKVTYNDKEFKISKPVIINRIKSLVARSLFENEGYYRVSNEMNEIYREALKHFGEAGQLASAREKITDH